MNRQKTTNKLFGLMIFYGLFLFAAANNFGQSDKTSTAVEYCPATIITALSPMSKPDKARLEICANARNVMGPASAEIIGETWLKTDTTGLVLNARINELRVDPDFAEKFKAGLKVEDAMEWLKRKNATDKEYREKTVNNAYFVVYGRNAKPIEIKAWEARIKNKEVWYKTIFTENIKQMSQSPVARTEAIHNAYNLSMGRNAKPDEIKRWMPLIERASPVVEANRDYLYSAKGQVDLLEITNRAFKILYPLWDGNINSKYEELTNNSKKYRYIHSQMLDFNKLKIMEGEIELP